MTALNDSSQLDFSKNTGFAHIFADYVRLFSAMPQKIAQYQKAQHWRLFRPKIVVYTAIVDNYDSLKIPQILSPEIDYVCFTNQPLRDVGVWQIRACPWLDSDSVKTARYIKTHPHYLLGDYDVAVWIDSNLLVCCDLMKYIRRFMLSNKSVGAVYHPKRQNIYQEIEACIQFGKDNETTMRAQVEKYRACGFEHNDLIESNFMMFRLDKPEINNFLNMWWSEIEQYSHRDQLSLNYCLHKSSIEWFPLFSKGICCRNNPDILLFLPHDKNQGFYQNLLNSLPATINNPYETERYAAVCKKRLKAVADKKIDVVVCVHNALEYVQQCIESLLKWHRNANERILIIDDGSDEPTAQYLQKAAEQNKCIRLIRHEQAIGYTKSANEGFRLSKGDLIILLNSDTVVTKNWSRKMADAVFSAVGAGVVGPMSNAASVQSLPSIIGHDGQTAVNILPRQITPQDMNELCEKLSDSELILRVPAVHGFCFGVTRECIDKLKGFDETHFPTGFGEETEFCLRVGKAGFSMVLATHTFVYHAKTKSFNPECRKNLCTEGEKNLHALYGKEMVHHVYTCVSRNQVLNKMRNTVQTLFDAYNFKSCPNSITPPKQKINFNQKAVTQIYKVGSGFAANAVNSLPFRKNAIATYFTKWQREIQFAVWYDAYGRIIVAKNEGGKWQSAPTQFYNNVTDAHNCVSVAVDGSGYVHLIWCRHDGKMFYARSLSALGLDFEQYEVIGKDEDKTTYPEFYRQPSGDLLLVYRAGYSGNGKLILNRYICRQKRWIRVYDALIDGNGQESPYWQVCTDKLGRLHISWCWRENNNVNSNHDMCYMCSTDADCTHFTDIAGKELSVPQTPENAQPIFRIPQSSSLINQTSMTTDENNLPYIATYWQCNGVLQYMLLMVEQGQWKVINTGIRKRAETLEGIGTQRLPCARPQILVYHRHGRRKIILLLCDKEFGEKLMLVRIKIKGDKISWGANFLTENRLGTYEPMYNQDLWHKKHHLSLFVQYAYYKQDDVSVTDKVSENVYVADVKL